MVGGSSLEGRTGGRFHLAATTLSEAPIYWRSYPFAAKTIFTVDESGEGMGGLDGDASVHVVDVP